jgi:uncharacterized repeat protein (TIGR02059 family)
VLLITLLSPINSNLTISAQAAYQTGSASFSAAGQYLSAANNSDFNVGSGDFTVEWWQFMNNPPTTGQIYSWPRAWTIPSATHNQFGLSIEPNANNPQVYFWLNGATLVGNLIDFSTVYDDKWTHFAITRTSNTVRIFVNGTLLGCAVGQTCRNSFSNDYDFSDATTALAIGSQAGSTGTVFPGQITNFHFVKGTSLYSANFTSPTAPRKPVANTKLLLLHKSAAGLLSDSSGLSKSVTIIGTPAVAYSSSAPNWAADTVNPTLTSASLASDGLSIVMNFSEDLSDLTAVPANFSVMLNGSESRVISSLSRSGTTVTLNLAAAISSNNSIALTYTDPTAGNDVNALQDEYGNDVATISNYSVLNPLNSSIDSAISLNGTNQYASASGAQVIPTSTSATFTVQAWIFPSNNQNSVIISQGPDGSNFYLKRATDGIVRFLRQGDSSENSCGAAPVQQWTHVAVVVGNSASECYLNGALVLRDNSGWSTPIGNGFMVGGFNLAPGNQDFYFAGQIDEVKVWNTSRTQSQIQGDLKTYGGSLANGLVAYYDFNELVGSTVLNRSTGGSAALNLTTTGAPTITSSSIFETSTVQAYTVVRFMRNYLVSSGGYKFPDTSTAFQYLIVGGGGGGGGGFNGGGGGGGGFRESTLIVNTTSPTSVVVGQGGNGAVTGFGPTNGETSTIFGINSTGGGKGATEQQLMSGPHAETTPDGKPTSGGSGGGGGHGAGALNSGLSGAAGNSGGYTPIEGFAGGTGNSTSSNACCFALGGGGGGGAGGLGENASNDGLSGRPGSGGIGRTSFISGSALNLAGGGGGGGRYGNSAGPIVRGSSASFGGGSGAQNTFAEQNATFNGVNGSANTGGGGGGGASTLTGTAGGGNGGSGLIIVRYITNKPTILTQPLSDTTTVGTVDTFTISTSAAPAPLTKSVQWQFTADTITGTTGWTNVSSGSGGTTDTFTTIAVTKAMNKFRYRAIVTFSDTATISVQETSTVAELTVNDAITITSDTSTITRKYGAAQTPSRTLTYSGGTTSSGAVGTSTSHTVRGAFGTLASGKIVLDTSTSTAVFRVDTATAVGTYVETITVTDFKGATATYAQTVVVTPADTLTVQADTQTATTYTGLQAILSETITVTGLVAGDTVSGVAYNYSASYATCANGGLCSVGEIGPSGGYVFYVSPEVINAVSGISAGGIYLEAAPVGAQGTAEYGCTGTQTPGTSYAVGSGAANTLAIINNCATAGIAARVTSNLTYAGFSDWFMPSLNEMTAIYNNLYNKTPSLGGFTGLNYGSSSEGTSGFGYQAYWWFGAGAVSGQTNKNLAVAYRPVRAFNPIYTSSVNYGPSTTKPTNAGTYTITPSALVLANNVDTSNYVWVDYRTSTFTINKARQDTLTVSSVLGVYETGTTTMKITTLGGSDTGTVTYAIASGGSASGCSVSSDVLTVTSVGTCKLVATKFATLNYLIAYSDTATITFTRFIERPLQVQLYPTMIPLNQGNALETTTVTSSTLTISAITRTGAGAYTITGTGFTNIELVTIGGAPVSGSNYTRVSEKTLTLSGVSSFMGPLLIRLADGQESVLFQFNWS